MTSVQVVGQPPRTRTPDDQTTALRITALTKTFKRADKTTITPVDAVDLTISQGEFMVLLGPSGCGKTTLLRCIAGLESPDSGTIEIDGSPVVDLGRSRNINVPPERRGLGMIFQSYALWPHMTVEQNVAYPLAAAKVPKAERSARVVRALATVGVSEIAGQLPGRLSGGQQQRVSLARALVGEPSLILFDEPLSNVDAKVREELRIQLVEMQQRIGFTAVYVTHDQIEAMELADRIAVLRSGKVAQLADPAAIYDHPTSRYVAKFIGSANELRPTVRTVEEDRIIVDLPGVLDGAAVPLPSNGPVEVGETVSVIWRPERTSAQSATDSDDRVNVTGTFVVGRYLGAYSDAVIRLSDGSEVKLVTDHVMPTAEGTTVTVSVATTDLHVFADGADA
ncbi:MAG: ABC transporter ATP-binding protein [Rhodococcus fascians]